MATQTKNTSKPAPIFEKFLELRSRVESDTSKLNSIVAHVESLKTAANGAREKWYATLELQDFQRWVEARAKLFAADPVAQEFSRTFGLLTTRAAGTDQAAEIVASCLREMKRALEERVEELRTETNALVARVTGQAAGAEDHPAIVQLLREITRLEDGISQIENSDAPPANAWADWNGTISEWITRNEPSLLK